VWACERDYSFVRTWVSLHDAAFSVIEKLGFVPREPLAYFGGRSLGTATIPAWDLRDWCITMGNSDNY